MHLQINVSITIIIIVIIKIIIVIKKIKCTSAIITSEVLFELLHCQEETEADAWYIQFDLRRMVSFYRISIAIYKNLLLVSAKRLLGCYLCNNLLSVCLNSFGISVSS